MQVDPWLLSERPSSSTSRSPSGTKANKKLPRIHRPKGAPNDASPPPSLKTVLTEEMLRAGWGQPTADRIAKEQTAPTRLRLVTAEDMEALDDLRATLTGLGYVVPTAFVTLDGAPIQLGAQWDPSVTLMWNFPTDKEHMAGCGDGIPYKSAAGEDDFYFKGPSLHPPMSKSPAGPPPKKAKKAKKETGVVGMAVLLLLVLCDICCTAFFGEPLLNAVREPLACHSPLTDIHPCAAPAAGKGAGAASVKSQVVVEATLACWLKLGARYIPIASNGGFDALVAAARVLLPNSPVLLVWVPVHRGYVVPNFVFDRGRRRARSSSLVPRTTPP